MLDLFGTGFALFGVVGGQEGSDTGIAGDLFVEVDGAQLAGVDLAVAGEALGGLLFEDVAGVALRAVGLADVA